MNTFARISLFAALVSTALARWGPGGPCDRDDKLCMSDMGTKYTNMVRARGNVGPLEAGSMYMLNNAFDHSVRMARGAPFAHQPIRRGVTVARGKQCEATLSGENIAQNNVPFSGPADPAKICVDAWERSPGHYRNMMSMDHRNTVVGIYVGSDGRIWCTQTFSRKRVTGAGMCKTAVMSAGQPPQSTKADAPASAPDVMVIDANEQARMGRKRIEEQARRRDMEMAAKKRMDMAREEQMRKEREKLMALQKQNEIENMKLMEMANSGLGTMKKPVANIQTPMPRMNMLKHQFFVVQNKNGRRSIFVQVCNRNTGLCRFCQSSQTSSCYSVGASRYFDNVLTNYGL